MLTKGMGHLLLTALLAGVLLLPGIATALQVGQKAPDFNLPATTGGKISLGQYHGKKLVLIEFYTGDFGPT